MIILYTLMFLFGTIIFLLFELIVWLPMCQRRNIWTHARQLEIVEKAFAEHSADGKYKEYINSYWTYNQMYSSFHITDVEKMKGPFKKPWYLIGNIGLLGCPLIEKDEKIEI